MEPCRISVIKYPDPFHLDIYLTNEGYSEKVLVLEA